MTATELDQAALRASASTTIARPADELYDMVADITRMGEWSTACRGGRWDDGASAVVGAWFTGVNVARDNEYETRNEVVAADRPHEVAWVAGGTAEGWARWSYRFEPTAEGTLVTESWDPVDLSRLVPDLTPDVAAKMRDRIRTGIEATLARLREVAEASSPRP
jgi:hypothetical protein